MNRYLVIVDFQRDFYNPEGALYVKNAEQKLEPVLKAIDASDKIIFTADMHPVNHCSFKEYGGIWPTHCVENSEGAGFPLELLMQSFGHRVMVWGKGDCDTEEEYGAFGREEYIEDYKLTFEGADEVVVCGIAAEYCVLETTKNLFKLLGENKDNVKLKVYLDGVAHFDPENKVLEDYMKENNIEEFKI